MHSTERPIDRLREPTSLPVERIFPRPWHTELRDLEITSTRVLQQDGAARFDRDIPMFLDQGKELLQQHIKIRKLSPRYGQFKNELTDNLPILSPSHTRTPSSEEKFSLGRYLS